MMSAVQEQKEYPDYRFYDDPDCAGNPAFNIWVGVFTAEEAEEIEYSDNEYIHIPSLRGRAGAVYIDEDSFSFFLPVLKSVLPNFYWWGGNIFNDADCQSLLTALKTYLEKLNAAQNMQDLIDLSEKHVSQYSWTFERLKPALVTLTEAFISIVQRAVDAKQTLWMDGP